MKLLIDQNISHRILPLLGSMFNDVSHVKDHGLINENDHDIFMFARKNNFSAIITIDDDFVRLLDLFSTPPKIIWVRTGNCSTTQLSDILLTKHSSISQFLASPEYALYEVFKIS